MDNLSQRRLVPVAMGQDEFIERKSRFIGLCYPVIEENQALAHIAAARNAHRDAAHVVYAYRLWENRICRHSDDGEPSGTAGMPLLDVFLRRDMYDFVCIAVRYFGGILLGAGGLTRAYARTGQIALDASGAALMRPWRRCALITGYERYDFLRRFLTNQGAEDIEADFAAEVALTFYVPDESVAAFGEALTEATAAAVSLRDTGVVWMAR